MRLLVDGAIGLAVTGLLAWVALVTLFLVRRPKGVDLREASRFVPDLLRLLRALSSDPDLPRRIRRRLRLLVVYLALPIDLIPDFLPVIGHADDLLAIAIVLRSVLRAAGPEAIDRHWQGTPTGRALVHRLAGMKAMSAEQPST